MSSFHSEYDGSIDLSERQLNDESFKLVSAVLIAGVLPIASTFGVPIKL